MQLDFRALKAFESIVRLGSFLKAAEELQYAPSTVTQQIQRLEDDLGVSLFVREGKRVTVTEAGLWLSNEASALLKSIGSIRQTVAEIGIGEAGAIRMAALEPAASQKVAPIIAEFCKNRPQVRLTMEAGGSKYIAERVWSGKLDFGVCASPPANLMLAFEPLFEERLGVLLRTDHPLAKQDSIATDNLVGQTILLKEQACVYRDLTEWTIVQKGHNPFSGIEVGSFHVIGRLVQSGLGVGIVPASSGLEWLDSVVFRPFADIDPKIAIGTVHRDKTSIGRAALTLMDNIQLACKM